MYTPESPTKRKRYKKEPKKKAHKGETKLKEQNQSTNPKATKNSN